MYNFHKIRSDPKSGEQKYIHSEFVKQKTIKDYILQLVNKNDHKIYSIIRVGKAYLVKEFE